MAKRFSFVAPPTSREERTAPLWGRRQFLFRMSLVVAAADVVPIAGWAKALPPSQISLSNLSLVTFANQVQTTFRVRTVQVGTLKFTLREVQELPVETLPVPAADWAWESFTLLFGGPPGELLPQNNYLFEHAQIGRFTLFLVPVGLLDRAAPRYEAVCCWLRPRSDGGA